MPAAAAEAITRAAVRETMELTGPARSREAVATAVNHLLRVDT